MLLVLRRGVRLEKMRLEGIGAQEARVGFEGEKGSCNGIGRMRPLSVMGKWVWPHVK